MRKLYRLLLILILSFNLAQAQTYYGRNLFGKMQIINDSICTVTFISWANSQSVDTCYMRKEGDTIFFSTKAQWKCRISAFENNQTVSNPWFHVAIKIYEYSYSNKKYEYTRDAVGAYDSTINSFVIEEFVFSRGNYIMVYEYYPAFYRVRCSFNNTDNNYIAIEENPDYFRGVVFNEFPLLVKGNRLIPIDKEKQMQCWLDNGFFFPKMKIGKQNKEYNIINGHYIGLRNLPAEMKQGISKPLPRKYLKYLNNK